MTTCTPLGCSLPITHDSIVPCSNSIKKQIEDIVVQCNSCGINIAYTDWSHHANHQCKLSCPYNCGNKLSLDFEETHYFDCDRIIKHCTGYKLGCKFFDGGESYKEHIRSCTLALLTQPFQELKETTERLIEKHSSIEEVMALMNTALSSCVSSMQQTYTRTGQHRGMGLCVDDGDRRGTDQAKTLDALRTLSDDMMYIKSSSLPEILKHHIKIEESILQLQHTQAHELRGVRDTIIHSRPSGSSSISPLSQDTLISQTLLQHTTLLEAYVYIYSR